MPPEVLQSWLTFVGVVCAAIVGVSAVMGLAYRLTLRKRLQRLERVLEAVEYHLLPNGHEHEGHEDDRNQAMRTLLLRVALTVRAIEGRLQIGDRWMRAHDLEHVRRDPEWTAGERNA